ncbi:MAG TPA: hemolysin family protein [Acidimicrobiales bacterium]|nr:hemolysin family protein [Acidimicrobiales bacterium]
MIIAAGLSTADLWMLVAIGVILVLLAFLAVAETSITRMNIVKAQALAEQGRRSGRLLMRLVERPERFLNPVLLMVNILQTVQAVLTGIVADRLWGLAGVLVSIVVNVILFFVFAESLPKTWAVLHGDQGALITARPVSALVRFPPLAIISRALIGLTNVIVPGKGLREGPFVSEQELLGFVQHAASEDVIEPGERELIESVIEFGDTIAREVMVPRTDMVTVGRQNTVTEAMDVAIGRGFSRLPVVGDDIDDIIGVAYIKDMTGAERAGRGSELVSTVMRAPQFVPETKKAGQLLELMQAGKFHLAIVVDEYGGTAGLITLEDLLEELVGDIRDEFDREEPLHETLGDGAVRVHGRLSISDLNELLDSDLPDDDWDTVGGLIFNTLGHVPNVGEGVDVDGYRFRVERLQGRRITRVRVTPLGDREEQRVSS